MGKLDFDLAGGSAYLCRKFPIRTHLMLPPMALGDA